MTKRGTDILLLSDNMTLVSQWNYGKNEGLSPQDFSCGSNKKVWWICEKGHEWEASINNRSKGRGCPYCSNRKVLAGYNDLQTTNPKLAAEWDFEKNGDLSPQNVTRQSGAKVWWKCKKGHSWEASVCNRDKGKGCPICKNKKVCIGVNSLSSVDPDLVLEWDIDKNGRLSPDDFTVGSEKKVWWKCKKGHSWYASIDHRHKGQGCPYCSNNKVLSGFNDLATVNPIVAGEWDYEKNGELSPDAFLPNSGVKVWWKCFRGHSWKTTIVSRNYGTGCPICSAEAKTSFPEQVCLYYFEKVVSVSSRDVSLGKEIDVYLPELKAGIEYDGSYYHNSKHSEKKENLKDEYFKNKGIRIFRIKEGEDNKVIKNTVYYRVDYKYSELPWAIYEISRLLKIKNFPVIDIERDQPEIYKRYVNSMKGSSLQEILPEIAKEWDYEKNGSLTPEMVSYSSMKVVWWRCKNNHSWSASVNNRNKAGCPICSNRKLLRGYNDLETRNPELVSEWDYSKNADLLPNNVLYCSPHKVWWKCDNNHSYEASIKTRSRGTGCPFCSNQKVLIGYNDLQTTNPKLAAEWDFEKNVDVTPQMFTQHSGVKVWWKCKKGHNWEASICNRSAGRGCPVCSNRVIMSGDNDLGTLNPALALEWNYEKNGNLTPQDVGVGSRVNVWWKCSQGHEWRASVVNRNRGTGCPFCNK